MFVILDQIAHYICRQTGARTGNRKWTGLEWRRKTTTRLLFEIIWWARTSVYRSLPSYVYSHWVMLKHNVSNVNFWILRYFYLVYRCATANPEMNCICRYRGYTVLNLIYKPLYCTVHFVLSYLSLIMYLIYLLNSYRYVHRCDFPSPCFDFVGTVQISPICQNVFSMINFLSFDVVIFLWFHCVI